jgi:hypothetical protein
MKKLLLALIVFPIVLFGQTPRVLVQMSDGSVQEESDTTVFPVGTLRYVTIDSLSKEINDKIFFASGEEVIIKSQKNQLTYLGFERRISNQSIFGKNVQGVNVVVPEKSVETAFAWELILLALFMFFATAIFQKAVIKGRFLILAWVLALNILLSLFFFSNDLINPLLYSVVALAVLILWVAFLPGNGPITARKIGIVRNVYFTTLLTFQMIFSFFVFPDAEELFYAMLVGIILGLPTIYWWRRCEKKKQTSKPELAPA